MPASKPAEIFVQLLAAELPTLKQTARMMRVPVGNVIFRHGDPGDGMYVIEEGRVEISVPTHNGQRKVLSHLGPSTFFGEMAVLDEQPRSATAIAAENTLLSFIPSGELWRVLERSPKLMISLVKEFSQRMRQTDVRFLEEVLQAERLSLVGRFAQSIVHDFKNPLNMIGFAADAAATEDAPPELRAEAKTIIRRQVDRMANMINELLEFTRGTTANIALTPVEYGGFVREVLREIEMEAEGQNVDVVCEGELPSITIPLDGKRLPHVIHNLINNAIDMMPGGGRITLRFRTDEVEVTTEIEDTGPGIAPEIATRLFEPFATHGKSKGTGLGLSICKRIIDDHRGRIFARSEPGRGAVFGFSLPRGE